MSSPQRINMPVSGADLQGLGGVGMEVLAFVRTRLFEIYILLFSLLVWLSILVYFHWTRKPGQVRWLLRLWSSNFIYSARAILGVRFKLEGFDRVPAGPIIFIGNHQAYWESIAMTVFVPHLNIVTKRASMQIPVFGWGLTHAPMIPVDRDQPGQNIRRMLRMAKEGIAQGRSLLIFPESGRVDPSMRRPFARGFETLYRHCGLQVQPFVTNAGLLWPKGFGTKRPGQITMRFLKPIPPGLPPREFARQIEELINSEKDKLLAESLAS